MASAAWELWAKDPSAESAEVSTFSVSEAPVRVALSCRRYAFVPTRTAAAATPLMFLEAFIASTTERSDFAPVSTTATVAECTRRPPESVAVTELPPGPPSVTLEPAMAADTVVSTPPKETRASVPDVAVASTLRPNAASAVPPVTWMLAEEPSSAVVSFKARSSPTDAVAGTPAVVKAAFKAAARALRSYVP
jgi:hypothetical protein